MAAVDVFVLVFRQVTCVTSILVLVSELLDVLLRYVPCLLFKIYVTRRSLCALFMLHFLGIYEILKPKRHFMFNKVSPPPPKNLLF